MQLREHCGGKPAKIFQMTIVAAYPAQISGTGSIPDFDEYGYLPQGIYNCDIEQIKLRFCNNDHRARQFEMLESYISRLAVFGANFACYLDGSFISDKEDPKDIDLVLEFPAKGSLEYQKIVSVPKWSEEKWLIFKPWQVKAEFGLHFFHWMPIMQVGGENDHISNFQEIHASNVIDIMNRKGIKVPLGRKKGILRIVV